MQENTAPNSTTRVYTACVPSYWHYERQMSFGGSVHYACSDMIQMKRSVATIACTHTYRLTRLRLAVRLDLPHAHIRILISKVELRRVQRLFILCLELQLSKLINMRAEHLRVSMSSSALFSLCPNHKLNYKCI